MSLGGFGSRNPRRRPLEVRAFAGRAQRQHRRLGPSEGPRKYGYFVEQPLCPTVHFMPKVLGDMKRNRPLVAAAHASQAQLDVGQRIESIPRLCHEIEHARRQTPDVDAVSVMRSLGDGASSEYRALLGGRMLQRRCDVAVGQRAQLELVLLELIDLRLCLMLDRQRGGWHLDFVPFAARLAIRVAQHDIAE